jgi:hypothetical protein
MLNLTSGLKTNKKFSPKVESIRPEKQYKVEVA